MGRLFESHAAGKPVVAVSTEEEPVRAAAMALRYGLPLLDDLGEATLVLSYRAGRLELRPHGRGSFGTIVVDFSRGRSGFRQRQGGSGLLQRALGRPRPLTVVDATAGLGEDGLQMAASGCSVVMIERHPVVAALLADGIERGRNEPVCAESVSRLELVEADAVEWLAGRPLGDRPEVIHLDPMYPAMERGAPPRKEMQLFRDLVGAEGEGRGLLALARSVATRRVVVKRSRRAAPLDQLTPAFTLEGRTIRYDIYLPS